MTAFEQAHERNMHILSLIRDDHGWALSRILLAERLERAARHIIADSPGTPDSVKKYLIRELDDSWGEPYEAARLDGSSE